MVLTGKGQTEKESVLNTYPSTQIIERFDHIFNLI
jgi:hypothetical protein